MMLSHQWQNKAIKELRSKSQGLDVFYHMWKLEQNKGEKGWRGSHENLRDQCSKRKGLKGKEEEQEKGGMVG